MVEPSSFRGALDLFNRLVLYDVVLPFLLIFTLVFALLEKTRVLGTEDVDGKPFPKRNLNSMMAFVIALFFVASAEMVHIVTEVSTLTVLFLLGSVLFLLLIGSFHEQTDSGFFIKEGALRTFFIIIMLVSLILIFMHAVGWLGTLMNFLRDNWQSNLVATVVFLLLIFGAIWFIVGDNSGKKK